MSYTGKLVLVELNEDAADYGRYYDGEYIVTDETPNQLFAFKYSPSLTVYGLGGFGSSQQIALTGRKRYNVVRVSEVPWGKVRNALVNVEKEIADVRSGAKKAQWVMHVYDRAESTIERLREIAPFQLASPSVSAASAKSTVSAEVVVTVPRGINVRVEYV